MMRYDEILKEYLVNNDFEEPMFNLRLISNYKFEELCEDYEVHPFSGWQGLWRIYFYESHSGRQWLLYFLPTRMGCMDPIHISYFEAFITFHIYHFKIRAFNNSIMECYPPKYLHCWWFQRDIIDLLRRQVNDLSIQVIWRRIVSKEGGLRGNAMHMNCLLSTLRWKEMENGPCKSSIYRSHACIYGKFLRSSQWESAGLNI